uniref:RNA polymerase sigma-70 domain-containing protein n=1 Tax=Compsopogon caeruleus TaxID=31354 RepID=A0A7S1TGY8_9RHOD|mmetsp:Transcript_6842/g.14042  ORF Transcript_6842/g.14042 Transcript_6842/m.14042 type:complete len:443 (+) Transcript_6842:239-1567(+)|eukprot:CAMPEP_0184685188 /NCGR_PEP_ID=MMETSP0312-20130426/18052_1 /TAXON_ID=31354 /ORGANISM="Compsopogon coeruleus, Strain SAG 36.94" /LENGTH=442 /DNA_ID=CAMNT_0027139037 /DNA_START=199 /DNA_END=1527 /DNA_ORIENTATION=+
MAFVVGSSVLRWHGRKIGGRGEEETGIRRRRVKIQSVAAAAPAPAPVAVAPSVGLSHGSAMVSTRTGSRPTVTRTVVQLRSSKGSVSSPTNIPKGLRPQRGTETGESVMATKKKEFEVGTSDGGEESLRQFCKEVRRVDMLKDSEVIQCAKAVKELAAWDTRRSEICSQLHRDPTDAEWASALGFSESLYIFKSRLRELHRQKDLLVAANLRLVVSIARRYINHGVTMSDLVQEGSLGLIRGAERFDHTKGFRFATYTSWWIKQAIQRSISRSSRLIRLPVGVCEISRKIARKRQELTMTLTRPPTDVEIAEELGLPLSKIRFVLRKTVETSTVSLHTPICQETADNSTTIGDLLETEYITPEESLNADLLRCDLENVLLMLSPREREVVRMRFGLDDGKTKDYEEIGSLYCVDGNRIRQIERRAMRKLKHPTLNSMLRDYI